MYLLLSGEGSSDIGNCNLAINFCDRDNFVEGPMTVIVDQLIEIFQGYEMSHLDTSRVSFVSERHLADNKLPAKKKSMSMRGKKKAVETKYYYENARALASLAKQKSIEVQDKVIAVLFRDSDGTASANRGNWSDKRESMLRGFNDEEYSLGVAMVPKPKSEAWLLCATKDTKYQNCIVLEDESGNDDSPNPLKEQLLHSLDRNFDGNNDICQLIREKLIDIEKIDMPSFSAFKENLKTAVEKALS
ncbi:hypothetical protein L9G74_12205 [Shewanella sp. C32]|uniref:Uncharacterized protein n=1 Tax=Shewanella electrica TaxID=515560 RepID=A0ABT2FML4_9GAMM|nr:hypothetical protein [Shewanella electrica]MCH1925486.1 hypothetical protein [Shewanella electrica]MCS4557207.1 hypothetical protein [Shewanella electrica]